VLVIEPELTVTVVLKSECEDLLCHESASSPVHYGPDNVELAEHSYNLPLWPVSDLFYGPVRFLVKLCISIDKAIDASDGGTL
jgi:hypothetical protein